MVAERHRTLRGAVTGTRNLSTRTVRTVASGRPETLLHLRARSVAWWLHRERVRAREASRHGHHRSGPEAPWSGALKRLRSWSTTAVP